MFENYKDILSVSEACEALSIGKNTIYDLLHKGILKSIKVSRKYLIPKEFIIEFVNTYR